MKPATPVHEQDLIRLLEVRYAAPAWAFLPFVRNATGFARRARTADGLAMSLWPSRGLELLGFEIKTARYDWLRELKSPEKADEMFGYFDRWYVVAGDDGVVEKGELPAAWGLMVKKGKRLKVVTEAPKLKPEKAIGLPLLAAILRRVQETKTPAAVLKAECESSRLDGVREGQESMKRLCDGYLKELGALKGAAETFERVCGVQLYRYDWSGLAHAQNINVAQAVKIVMNGRYMEHFRRLMALRDSFQEAVKAIDDAVSKAQTEEAKA